MERKTISRWVWVCLILNFLALALLGWVIYKQIELESRLNSLNERSLITENTNQENQEEIEPPVGEDIAQIVIEDWGLESHYSNTALELMYRVEGNRLLLTEESLYEPDATGQYCDYGDLGIIVRYGSDDVVVDIQEAKDKSILAAEYFEGDPSDQVSWSRIDDNYYMFIGPQAVCINKNDNELLSSIQSGKEVTRNLQKIN